MKRLFLLITTLMLVASVALGGPARPPTLMRDIAITDPDAGTWTDVRAYLSMPAAIAALVSDGSDQDLLISLPIALTADLTVPDYVKLVFTGDGTISIANTFTLTINGPIEASPKLIFTGAGTVAINGPGITYLDWDGSGSGVNVGITGAVQFDPDADVPDHNEALLYYDDVNKTLALYNDEEDITLQIGQENWLRGTNVTGSQIDNGKLVYISGESDGLPEMELAVANDDTSLGTIAMATHDIAIGAVGVFTRLGTVRDVNTAGCTSGDILYLSETSDGDFTNVPPTSPNYLVRIGVCTIVDATNGSVEVDINSTGNTGDVIKFYNGAVLEDHDIEVTSNGSVVSLAFEKDGGGNLSLFFSGIFSVFDATPAATVVLTAGSDTSPTLNYVYIPEDTKLLTTSTVSFPTAQAYAPVASVLVQSAASVQTYEPYKVHAWTDHLSNTLDQGHLSHINTWLRHQPATWMSGAFLSTDVGIATYDVAVSSGIVMQLHHHAFPAFDTDTGSDVYVVNDVATSYKRVGDLTGELVDSIGGTLSGRYYSLVIWGVVSEDSTTCKLMCNLPSGSYANSANALADASSFTDFTIPNEFRGTGFLIAKLVTLHSVAAGGTWSIVDNEDLRGQLPQSGAGGASATGSIFPDNVFRIFDEGDVTKNLAFEVSGVTTAFTRTMTIPDYDVDLNTYTSTLGTPGNNQVAFFYDDNTVEGDADLTWSGSLLDVTGNTAVSGVVIAGSHIEHNADNDWNTFGAAADAYITYDGSDMLINPQNVGTGDVVVSAGGLGVTAGDVILESGSIVMNEITSPSADAGYGKVYTKDTNRLYFLDGAGYESSLTKDRMVFIEVSDNIGISTFYESYTIVQIDTTVAHRTHTLPSVGATEDGLTFHFQNDSQFDMNIIAADSDTVWKLASEGIVSTTAGGSCSLTYDHANTMWKFFPGAGRWMVYGLKAYLQLNSLEIDTGGGSTEPWVTDLTYRNSFEALGSVNISRNNTLQNFGPVSMVFNGTTGYIYTFDSPDWDIFGSADGSHTISMWVRADDAVGTQRIFISQYEDGANFWYLARNSAGNLRFMWRSGGTTYIDINAGAILQNTWHFVTVCRDGSAFGTYLDDSQVGWDGAWSTGTVAGNLYIAQNGASAFFFDGRLQDIPIMNQNLFGLTPVVGVTDTLDVPEQLLELVTGP